MAKRRRREGRRLRTARVWVLGAVVALALSLFAGADFAGSALLRLGGLAGQAAQGLDELSGAVGAGAEVADGASVHEATAWDEAESPNYVRLVGAAHIDEELTPGEVVYSGLDGLGRAGGVRACVTFEMMEAGSSRKRAAQLPDPAGWGHNAQVQIGLPTGRSYNGWFWNRSHLLAKSLGGSDALDNLVCGTRMQNVGANDGQGGMAMVETACRDWLEAYPDVSIQYVATPVYVGDEVVPRSVFVDVRSSDGAIDECVEVFNAAKGYRIDYATGEFWSE